MKLQLFQVDAFADKPFEGNPAAIVPLETWLDDALMQRIAAENNLAETAFFVPAGEGFHLRWFTPSVEVDLCGHATLASAHVLFRRLGYSGDVVRFATRSGELRVRQADGGFLEMDFPAQTPAAGTVPAGLAEALGAAPVETLETTNMIAVFDRQDDVAALEPNFPALEALLRPRNMGLIATAPADKGTGWDFVSRFFAPAHGINEDPVTGSAHCSSVPYWADRLGKPSLVARQISSRGGTVHCEMDGARVKLRGVCAPYMEGVIEI